MLDDMGASPRAKGGPLRRRRVEAESVGYVGPPGLCHSLCDREEVA